MALTKVSGGILDPGINVAGIVTATGFDGPFTGGSSKNITAGIITATGFDLNGNGDISGNLVIGGNLTANGDFTTLNTTLREVEILRVDANTTAIAGIITQRGSGDILNLYDGSTEVFSVDASGRVKIGTTSNKPAAANEAGIVFGDNTAGTVKKGVASFCADGAAPLLLTRRVSDGNVLGIADDVGTKGLIRVNSNNLEITSIYALTLATGTGHNQKVRLTNDGKVGIGSMIPSATLDVNGTSKFNDDITLNGANFDITYDRSLNTVNFDQSFLKFGTSGNMFIRNSNIEGLATIKGPGLYIRDMSNAQMISCYTSGQIELYHNNVKTAFTSLDAWNVYGRTSNSGMIEIASNQGANNNDRFRIHKTSAASRLTIQEYASGNWVENIRINAGGAVELKHADGTTKLETTSAGSKISGNLELSSTYPSLVWTDTNHNSDFRITNDDGKLIVYDTTRGAHVMDFLANGDVRIRNDKSLIIGEGSDLKIFHDSSANNNVIEGHLNSLNLRNYNTNCTDIVLSARRNIILQTNLNETAIQCIVNGATEIFHDGGATPKLRTTTTGIQVLGEVAASQDYPNFRPVLDFNFAAVKKLDPRITYQRIGPASFTDEFGKVVLVGDNAPRFDHDLTTRESKGLLFEESRTNFMKYSDEFATPTGQTGGNWDAIGGSSDYTRVSDTTETKDPTGTNHASKLTFNSGNATLRGYWYSGAANGAVTKTYSVYLKRATSNTTTVAIDIGDTNLTTYTLTDEWKRYSVTTSSAGNGNFVDMTLTSGASTPYYAWGAQIEAGAFPTSYIPTGSAAVTRGADIALIDGEEFSEFYNPFESTILVDYTHHDGVTTSNIGNQPRVYNFRAPSGSDTRIDYVSNTNYNPYIAKDGSTVASISDGVATVFGGGANRTAVRVKEDSFATCFNGTLGTGDTSGAWNPTNTITEVSIGGQASGSAGNQLSGHIQRFMYYPVGLPDSQLVTLTS